MITDLIKKNKEQFLTLCKTHKINSLFAFGSSVSGNFNAESDIDLVVDITETDPLNKGELLFSLWDKLELFFKRKVDLLTNNSIRNPVLRESIEKNKQLIYDGAKEKVLL